jgi:ABC-type multidrug transport system ATPase subunit
MDEAERCTHVGYIYLSRLIAVGRPEALKSMPDVTPPGTRRFEVSCASPTAALARARRSAAVRDATLFGDTLHVLAAADRAPEQLLAELAPGDNAATIRPIPPTLEDVFVILSRAQTAQGVS